ncbi:MAG: hypothetical protein KC560_17190, partial [Myxococcales bacterium]|nr:hypothetical protein [Myxococcales bacterium]
AAPELVVLDADGAPQAVRYQLLAPMLVGESQRQERELARQREELAAERAKVARLEARIAALEARLGAGVEEGR